MVTISTTKKDLLQTLKYLKIALKSSSFKDNNVVCEITITKSKATFAVPGAIFSLICDTKGVAKVTLPFIHLFEIIKSFSTTIIDITIEKDLFKIGTFSFPVKTTFIEDDSILRTIALPLNFTDIDILLLQKKGYTDEELAFNDTDSKIDDAVKRMNNNIEVAYNVLKFYGVSLSEISDLVNSKL